MQWVVPGNQALFLIEGGRAPHYFGIKSVCAPVFPIAAVQVVNLPIARPQLFEP